MQIQGKNETLSKKNPTNVLLGRPIKEVKIVLGDDGLMSQIMYFQEVALVSKFHDRLITKQSL